MAALLSSGMLPAPKHQYRLQQEEGENAGGAITSGPPRAPPYMSRQRFVPRDAADFGDGGAFPEIHVVQYPLGMGKPGAKSSAIISVDVDEHGQVRHDAIVKQGSNKDRLVQTSLSDMKEKKGDMDKMALPEEEEERSTAERTRLALELLVDGKIKASKPNSVAAPPKEEDPTYIRYTPNPNAPGFNPAAKQRVIRMVEAQVDPMEPPKHKHKKIPRGPPSPPVPVLHSPPRKLTVQDQQAWKIPPCISNWKNARGYTIPLDKRLAADGRGLQEVTINNKFATLSESLYVAERKASEGLKMRSQLRKKMSIREKEEKEAELRDMANRARMERSGGQASSAPESQEEVDTGRDGRRGGGGGDQYGPGDGSDEDQGHPGESEEDRTARYQREKLRVERRKERERELRIDNMKVRDESVFINIFFYVDYNEIYHVFTF
jgi:SNW domain-containing protein 1